MRGGLEAEIRSYLDSGQPIGGVDLAGHLDGLLLVVGKTPPAVHLELIRVLLPLRPDPESLAAALWLPRVFETGEIPGTNGGPVESGVARLLGQFLTLGHYGRTFLPEGEAASAEGLRRLLLALIEDVRVVLLALAWQVVRLRNARDRDGPVREALARETRLIHSPLANRLGIWQLKWELEDLAFRYLEPDTYNRISRLVAERRADRQAFIESFMARLRQVLAESGVEAQVTGRVKHIYSIWKKMQRKGLDFHELFDVRAVRVLVDDLTQCYTVLGHVNTHWQPVPGEFDDYIANPKGNGYQSLHTAVTGSGGQVVEVQIRTHDMHRHAELGVAAHWRYKEGGPRDSSLENKITVMRQLLEAGEEAVDDNSLLENFQNLTTEDRVYALTPQGEVVDLAAGATPLDFAYHIHTEVGHRCRGARVNGRIVPLTRPLENGDRVEILTAREPRPSRDWLSLRLGYIRTGRARSKVRHWFRTARREENLAAGEQSIQAELERLDLADRPLEDVLGRFNLKRIEDLYVAVGNGDLTASQVGQAVAREAGELDSAELLVRRRPDTRPDMSADEVRIEGVGNLMYQLAQCCQPLPGDEITGFVTRGRGVSIHRADCREAANLVRQHPERILEVRWGGSPAREYPVRIRVIAWDRKELIRDIGSTLAADGVSVAAMQAAHEDSGEAQLELTVRISDYEQLSGLLGRLSGLQGVIQARRVRD